MINAASSFADSFKSKVKSTTEAFESSSWMSKFFNRNAGKHEDVINITTVQPGGRGAFSVSFSFDNLPSLAIDVDDSHLEAAKDLDEEFINVNTYDEATNREIWEILKKMNDGKSDVSQLPEVKGPEISASGQDETVEVKGF
jgi:hypothetical protein